jgi:hypothetical protein
MMTRVGVFVALLVTLGGGWLWGASGRWELGRTLQTAELRADLREARLALLGARVSLYEADFVGIRRQLENARGFVARADARLGPPGLRREVQRLDLTGFTAEIDEAQRLAAKLDKGAGATSSR